MTPPDTSFNLIDLLRTRARTAPSRSAYTFLADGVVESAHLSYQDLDARAQAIASRLRDQEAHGQRALLLYPPGLDFIVAFLGCLYAGVVAVPAYPAKSRRALPRLRAIANDANPRFALTRAAEQARFESICAGSPELKEVQWLATDTLVADSMSDSAESDNAESYVASGEFNPDSPAPDQLAFLQYTSGSTAAPRGVRVTHGSLSHNLGMIRQAFGQTSKSVIVGWLPVYHDMGLIGNLLLPLWVGARCILMSPVAFLQQPLRWLQAISRYRATTSGGPNFAYELCARKLTSTDVEGLDLTRWQVAFNGSEPVRAETLGRFAAAFESCGFRSQAFFPCYGLAEATLLVSGGHVTTRSVASVAERDLEQGVVTRTDNPGERTLVGCELSEFAPDVRIVDPESAVPCAAGRVGEIWASGPSIADGYWNRPSQTARDFGATLCDAPAFAKTRCLHKRWLRTGDLGFLQDGQLFVTGRLKDLIILRGRNLYPQDIEWTAERSHPAIRPGSCAAFSVDHRGEECLVIVGELERRRNHEAAQASEALRRAVGQSHEAPIHEVVWVRFGTILKTSSGKIRRRACRSQYLEQELRIVATWQPKVPAADPVAFGPTPADQLPGEGAPDRDQIESFLRTEIAHAARIERAAVEPRLPLVALGIDSLAAAELRTQLKDTLQVTIALPDLLDNNLTDLTSEIFARQGNDQPEELQPDSLRTTVWPPLTAHHNPTADHPLSHGQKALWFFSRLAPTNPAYNLAAACRIRQALDPPTLGCAFSALVRRHPMLRVTFETVAGEPRQRIADPSAIGELGDGFRAIDATQWDGDQVRSFIDQETSAPFDLEQGPLARLVVLEQPDGEHTAILVIHHIITDFWSLEILAQELGRLYSLEVGNSVAPAEASSASYTDWVRWQEEMLAGPAGDRLWKFWRQQLEGVPDVLALATDRPRPPLPSYRGARVRLAIDRYLTDATRELAQCSSVTLFMTLLTAFQALLHRYSGQDHLAIGTPAANRRPAGIERVVGYCVNSLVIVADLSATIKTSQALRQTKTTVLAALEHQDYPFSLLAERLQPARGTHRTALIQTMFVLEAARQPGTEGLAALTLGWPGVTLDLGPLTLESIELNPQGEVFDLSLTAAERGDGLAFALDFDRDLFDSTTIRRMLGQLRTLLSGIVANPEHPLALLPLLPKAELMQLLVEWNDSGPRGVAGSHGAADRPVWRLIEDQARSTPDAVAVSFGDQHVTYLGLSQHATELAYRLRRMGARPEGVIGLCAERSVDLVAGILAIWQAGGTYLPLDASYPTERLALMLTDARAEILLAGKTQLETLNATVSNLALPALPLDRQREPAQPRILRHHKTAAWPRSLAYITYTSGSSGRPKGVAVEHQALAHHLTTAREMYGLTSTDRVLQFAAPGFDVALEQTFTGLIAGATVVLDTPGLVTETDFLDRALATRLTVLDLPPSLWQLLFTRWAEDGSLAGHQIRWAISGGEAMPPELARLWRQLPDRPGLINAYGPTEGVITASTFDVLDDLGPNAQAAPLPIGQPWPARCAYVLDRTMAPRPLGLAGELFLGGYELARGYLHRPRHTARAFVPDPFSWRPGARLYRTGDRVRQQPEGSMQWLARIDRQVKLRGFRIELGEIEEALIQHPQVQRAAAIVRGNTPQQERIVAYVQASDDLSELTLRTLVSTQLPPFMVPARIQRMDALPLTADGGVDRSALPHLEDSEAASPAAEALPNTRVEQRLATLWKDLLQLENIGLDDSFFELGGHSLLLLRAQHEISKTFGQDLPITELFQYPTLRTLARRLTQQPSATPSPRRAQPIEKSADIAVIGLACRVPGAEDAEMFWRNLCDGVESITTFSDSDLRESGLDEDLVSHPQYVKASGILREIDLFDAAFFGYSPREAELMDPQQRLFLECAWQAVENAGYSTDTDTGPIGVFAGLGASSYWLNNLATGGESAGLTRDYQLTLANEKDFLPTRVSFKLNLQGPSVNVQTACSTSLVAVHMASQSLRQGECDLALAGGVSIKVPHRTGYLFEEDMILSPDGHCRAFDASAQGTVIGNGLGIVVLKRLSQAVEDEDTILAVIKGSAINNDGSLKVGFTAPSATAQQAVISQAMANAGVTPSTIDYVETHGTGTPLGDPIEISALKGAFGDQPRNSPCKIGSVKTNLGHLDAAAGIAGLIKTVLALHHRQIPPSLHFERANPRLGLEDSPFAVQRQLTEWPAADDRPRRAGVSSFGIGGTNAHVVLEEAPPQQPSEATSEWQLLVVSAKSHSSLDQATADLARYLDKPQPAALADVAWTLQTGRRHFPHRRFAVGRDAAEMVVALNRNAAERLATRHREPADRPVAFLFPGQGAQYVNMSRGLYRTQPVFRQHLDHCAEILLPHLGLDLRLVLYPDDNQIENATAQLRTTAVTQPALFAVEFALAQCWIAWGVRPHSMLGHSLGEYVAACVADVFHLEDALAVVALRARLMQQLPAGAMSSVPLSSTETRSLMPAGLALAADNGPDRCVVSGPVSVLEAFEHQLTQDGGSVRRLDVSHAFHSQMMAPVLASFTRALAAIELRAPRLPYLSNVTGTWIQDHEATDPEYWARHLCEEVRYRQGFETLVQTAEPVLLEIGPGQSLSTLARRHPEGPNSRDVLTSLPHVTDRSPEDAGLMTTLGKLWLAGVSVDWRAHHQPARRRRVPLPTYPFERQRFWIEPTVGQLRANHSETSPPALPRQQRLEDWFYSPSWRRAPPPTAPRVASSAGPAAAAPCWLLFLDENSLGRQLASRLVAETDPGTRLVTVSPGTNFSNPSVDKFLLDPTSPQDYEALFEALQHNLQAPSHIVHLWTATALLSEAPNPINSALNRGFYSLLFMAQALARHDSATSDAWKLTLTVVSSHLHEVNGDEQLVAEKATVLGLVGTIPREFPTVECRNIDVALAESGTWQEQRLIDQLVTELRGEATETRVAYRGNHRLLQTFERFPLPSPERLRLRERGVYLLTGGLGGLGLALAKQLATRTRPKLVLIGRSAFPDRELRDTTKLDQNSLVGRQLGKLRELENLGAEVLVVQADVTDYEQMLRARDLALKRFGAIHGVIHAAGVASGGPISLLTRETAAATLAPKLQGTLILDQVLADEALDFMLLCSSLTSSLGSFGEADYAAANAFLDAFAHIQQATHRRLTVSVGWDAWRDAGMAARAIDNLVGTPALEAPVFDTPVFGLPLFESVTRSGADQVWYTSHLNPSSHWVVREHKLFGQSTLPGTAYLEMARSAFTHAVGDGPLEMRDVTLVSPCGLVDGETKQVRTTLEGQGEAFEFRITSRPPNGTGPWLEHARGHIAKLGSRPTSTYQLNSLAFGCPVESVEIHEEARESTHGALDFGPRWDSLKQLRWSPEEGLAALELHSDFGTDLESFALHPALLDTAANFLLARLPTEFLPFSYRQVNVFEPLPAKIYSHAQRSTSQTAHRDSLQLDVTLMDERGVVLAEIAGYTLIALDEVEGSQASTSPSSLTPSQPTEAVEVQSPTEKIAAFRRQLVDEGISNSEGGEILERLIAGCPPQILISTHDLPALEAYQITLTQAAFESAETIASHPRPELSTTYVAPSNTTEKTLATIWQEMLGVEAIGTNDNFFELGGDSLVGTQVISKVRAALKTNLPLTSLFERPTIAGQSELLNGSLPADDAATMQGPEVVSPKPLPLERASREAHPALSPAQRRLWFLDRLEGPSAVYNLPVAIRLDGALDRTALAASLSEIQSRHETLRTTFPTVDSQPFRSVTPASPVTVPVIDLRRLDIPARELETRHLAKLDATWTFNLETGPLLRASLVHLGSNSHVLLVNMHHINVDAWSVGVFEYELSTLYGTFHQRQQPTLPRLPITYSDFVRWQQTRLSDEVLDDQISYWQDQLAGAPTLLRLPTDRPRPPSQTFRGDTVQVLIDAQLTEELKHSSTQSGVTLFMTLLAAYAALLSRHSGQSEVVIGSPVANRDRLEIEPLIGMFINTLALRINLGGRPTVETLMHRVRQMSLDGFARQDLPFEQLVDSIQIERSLSHSPLFQVLFILLNAPAPKLELAELELTVMPLERPTAKLDITLMVEVVEHGLIGHLEYRTDLFDVTTIRRFGNHYRQLLSTMAREPRHVVEEIALIGAAEQQQVLVEWNDTAANPPQRHGMHQLFEDWAARTPSAVALRCGDRQLTYHALNSAANRLAHRLRAFGFGAEDTIGIAMERSHLVVVALLGVLKANAAYLPLDLSYPAERLAYIIEDSGAGIILTDSTGRQELPACKPKLLDLEGPETRFPDTQPNLTVAPDQAAYVIYTSGSTGHPKGVWVPHHGVVGFLQSMAREPGLADENTLAAITTLAFDISVLDLFLPLSVGGRVLILTREEAAHPRRLARNLADADILQATPATWQMLIDSGWDNSSRIRVLTGGEALPAHLGQRLAELSPAVWNLYGPTEATVWATLYPMTRGRSPVTEGCWSIGRPIDNTKVYLLDHLGQPTPRGVSGELCIASPGVTRGYSRLPTRTAIQFVPDNVSKVPGGRLYRTGDLACHDANGLLQFQGRFDQQLKIRGFRIELGEIESTLHQQPGVGRAVVDAQEEQHHERGGHGGGQRLVAYVVPDGQIELTLEDLRRLLGQTLPEYMLPTGLVVLDELPLSPNGKVDRRRLPAPAQTQAGGSKVAPEHPVDQKIAEIWRRYLGVEELGIHDSFFELGGHSLLAIKVITSLFEAFEVEISLHHFFTEPTVASLAETVRRQLGETRPESSATPEDETSDRARQTEILPAPRQKSLPVSYAQHQQWLADRLANSRTAFNLSNAMRLTGSLEVAALEATFGEIVRRHEALRTRFPPRDGVPVQVIDPPQLWNLPFVDLVGLSAAEHRRQIAYWGRLEAQHVFDLATGPLLRTILIQLKPDEHMLLVTMHHIVSDAWSMGVFRQEAATLYEAAAARRISPLPELPIQYADFSAWQRQIFDGPGLEAPLRYWQRQLAGVPVALKFPDRLRSPTVGRSSGKLELPFPDTLFEQVRELGQQQGASRFMVLLAAFQALLYRFSQQRDFCIGVPISGRGRIQIEGLIGNFLNVLAMRARIEPGMTFGALLARVRQASLGAFAHQDLPFEKLLGELAPERELGRQPLFQVVFNYTGKLAAPVGLPTLDDDSFDARVEVDSKYELSLYAVEQDEGLDASLVYDAGRFNATTIEWLGNSWIRLLENAVAEPHTNLEDLSLLSATERNTPMTGNKKRAASRLAKLGSARRQTVSAPREVSVKKRFLATGQDLPRVIEPEGEGVDLATWVAGHRAEIEEDVLRFGAVLFRGFAPLPESQLGALAQVITPQLLDYVDGSSPRLSVSSKVYTSTEYPPEFEISMHNELSYAHRWPGMLFFYCGKAAERGGETPLADSRRVLAALPEEVKARFLAKGVRYVRNLHGGTGAGLSWQQVFETTDQSVVEDYCRDGEISFEWRDDGGLALSQDRPAIAVHPRTGESVWFNQADQFHPSNLGDEIQRSLATASRPEDYPTNASYGDGEPIQEETLASIRQTFAEVRVLFPWQPGDFLVVDNMLTAHGRMPFEGSRQILVTMGAPIDLANGGVDPIQ